MTGRFAPRNDACTELAARLEIDLDSSGVCLACLSFVSIPLADGDEPRARRETRRLVVDLWDDGLNDPLFAALVRAREDGVPGAEAALDDIAARGPRADVVRAVVLRLAAELAEQARAEFRLLTDARARASRGLPELN